MCRRVARSEIGGNRAAFLHQWLRGHAHLAPRFADAERATPVEATGPFASHSRRAWAPGAALVGDAADFFDPFTGEGIYAALRGGEMLATAALAAVGARTTRDADLAFADVRRRAAKRSSAASGSSSARSARSSARRR